MTVPGRYIKRPVTVEAIRYDGSEESADAIAHWAEGTIVTVFLNRTLNIDYPEGVIQARPGEWIIRDAQGEYYPRRPDVFGATHRPAPQGSAAGLTDPDAAYLRRIAVLLPGKHRDRAYTIAQDIELFLTRVEDAIYEIDHAGTTPERRLADVRELLAQCLVAEDTRINSGPEDGNPPTPDRMQALAAFQAAVTACTLGLDGDALATVLSQALQAAQTAASSQRLRRG
ncbi:hypothetical protein [Actinomyces ruminis]|uniref:Uncharacterized protein n=1 Tax=Actinomyces ruminis TaxID=1937003 RepID=A0ABX4MAV8_9ACTO|nr:hypothetical protein [Actinomyces ruminis]PHP52580.1 hypothetical protein BW737_008840 [Actinomyces ruminis]